VNYGFFVSGPCFIVPLAVILERFSYLNIGVVLILSLLESILSFISGLEIVRVILYGIGMPYVLGVAVVSLKQIGLWAWLGYAMMPVGLFTGAFSFFIFALKKDMEVSIKDIVLLVLVGLLLAYPSINIVRNIITGKKYVRF